MLNYMNHPALISMYIKNTSASVTDALLCFMYKVSAASLVVDAILTTCSIDQHFDVLNTYNNKIISSIYTSFISHDHRPL